MSTPRYQIQAVTGTHWARGGGEGRGNKRGKRYDEEKGKRGRKERGGDRKIRKKETWKGWGVGDSGEEGPGKIECEREKGRGGRLVSIYM